MGATQTTRECTPYAGEIAWPVERLEAGDFCALSSDGKRWYSGNIFGPSCSCPWAQYHPREACKHAQAARAEYWTRLDAYRREQAAAARGSRRVGPALSEYDLAGAPGYELYYASLEHVA